MGMSPVLQAPKGELARFKGVIETPKPPFYVVSTFSFNVSRPSDSPATSSNSSATNGTKPVSVPILAGFGRMIL